MITGVDINFSEYDLSNKWFLKEQSEGKDLLEVPSCSSPDGDRLIHALRNEENPPRDSPGGAALNGAAASPDTEKPSHQIPKKRLCCALSRGFSMLREEVSKEGEWHLKKSYCNLHEFSFDVDFFLR